ncbi:MAG: lipoyl synthase [bacterium]|nr:MAG: lipoyl synthase [bacterium]
MDGIAQKPEWLRKKVFYTPTNQNIRNLLKSHHIHTVCEEARCPNLSECYNDKTATFLIMGDICTRSCLYCSVESTSPSTIKETLLAPPDPNEPERIAKVVQNMGLHYVVITSVNRDDLPDGGADHFVKTLKAMDPSIKKEVLTPDFKSEQDSIAKVVREGPDVFNHNVETVERVTPKVRKQGSYRLSLSVLEKIKRIDPNMITKTGIMLGLGEKDHELNQFFKDLRDVGCDILTMGQYLQASRRNYPVQSYIPEDQFNSYREKAISLGIPVVHSAPFVRSSYRAFESYHEVMRLRN